MKSFIFSKSILYSIAIIFGLWLVVQSQIISTLDQGDYGRAISMLLNGPADEKEYRHWEKPTLDWSFKEPFRLSEINNTGSAYFLINAYVQRIAHNSFSLPLLSITSKLLLLIFLGVLSKRIAEQLRWKLLGEISIWIALLCAFFMAHNIYILNSFYQEHALWLGLPLILCGLLDDKKMRSTCLIIFGAIISGGSKTQFFYLPILIGLLCLAWGWWKTKTINKPLLIGLLAVQILCTLPLLKNPYKALNFYHATYYGSYTLLDQRKLNDLNIPTSTVRCIGSDRWGALLSGKHGDGRGQSINSCFDKVSLDTSDVLRPYFAEPTLIWRMWQFAEPALWTAKPFHNIHEQPYIVTTAGMDQNGAPYPFPANNFSLNLSDEREVRFTHRVGQFSLLALGICLLLLYKRWLGNVALAILFLVALIWSQIFIALLGEGFRDLGKHFAAAQLSYDILLIFIAISVVGIFQKLLKIKI
jgi:hypothetical protein